RARWPSEQASWYFFRSFATFFSFPDGPGLGSFSAGQGVGTGSAAAHRAMAGFGQGQDGGGTQAHGGSGCGTAAPAWKGPGTAPTPPPGTPGGIMLGAIVVQAAAFGAPAGFGAGPACFLSSCSSRTMTRGVTSTRTCSVSRP